MMELYDLGRTTHRAVKGMYEFIIDNIDKYVSDNGLAEKLKEEAKIEPLRTTLRLGP